MAEVDKLADDFEQDHPKEEPETTPPILIEGEADGTKLCDILVDTGTNTTFVSQNLVSW